LEGREVAMGKRIVLFCLILMSFVSLSIAGERQSSPNVRYTYPRNEAVVDLTGKEELEFTWKKVPIPDGGRSAYKFNLYKGFGYEELANEKLDEKVYSIKIPANIFKNGGTYTWQVKQRSMRSRVWGKDNRWSFTVKK
jgi:hypothetical protein